MRSCFQNFAIAFILSFIFGCAGTTQHISDAAVKVDDAAGKLRDGLSDVSKGLEKIGNIDPLAIKQLMKDKEDLRKQVEQYQTKFNSYAPIGGAIVVNGTNRIYLKIADYKGTFKIDAWVNDTAAWFLQNQPITSAKPTLNIIYDVAVNLVETASQEAWKTKFPAYNQDSFLWGCRTACQGQPDNEVFDAYANFGSRMPAVRVNIDNEYRTRVQNAFNAFLASNYTASSPEVFASQAIDKHMRLVGGEHIVYARVTPIAAGPDNKWSIKFVTYSHVDSGADDPINTITIDNDKWNNFKYNMPLPPIPVAQFYVIIKNQ